MAAPLLSRLSPILITLALAQPLSALAQIPDLTWNSPQVVDSPVTAISAAAGNQAAYWNADWWITYEKEGRVWLAGRGPFGWSPPIAVTSPGIPSRSPHVADASGYQAPLILVVWEDDRRGHSEVWSRRFDGVLWSVEECLSDDAVPSRGPAAAGGSGGAYVVWEDSTAGIFRAQGREYATGGWRPVETISSNPASSREPTVGFESWMPRYHIAWTDSRNGTPQIFYRSRMVEAEWGPERLIATGGHPSIHPENCCGDMIGLASFVLVYEAAGDAGATESRGICYMEGPGPSFALSPDDGIPSLRPHATGFGYWAYHCNYLGGMAPKYFGTWTDVPPSGPRIHGISEACRAQNAQEILSERGVSDCGMAAREGNPEAELLAYWIEEIGGVPSLVTRIGRMPGCSEVTVEAPPALVIAPEGNPPTIVRAVDRCGDLPVPDLPVTIEFDDILDAALTWDPAQPHPTIDQTSGANGDAVFAIRGGGCSQAGDATVTCDHDIPFDGWSGAKSPDIDGDCAVRANDVDTVRERIGTDDFCADLDGSGVVDSVDLAIVTSALGDHCTNVLAVDETFGPMPSLSVSPNPATTRALLRLESPRAGRGSITLYDAAGRRVRVLDEGRGEPGKAAFDWDMRDTRGRRVPCGIYFAVARITDGTVLRRAIVVTR